MGGVRMSEKLIINYQLEKEKAKKLTVETGHIYFEYGRFELEFNLLSSKVREMVYDDIESNGKINDPKLSLDLTKLVAYYEDLEKSEVSFEKFDLTKDFFTVENFEKYIQHFYEVKELYQNNSKKINIEPYFKFIYRLDPEYVKAKEIINGYETEDIQTLKWAVRLIPENMLQELTPHLIKIDEDFVVDFTKTELLAKKIYKMSDAAQSFIRTGLDLLNNKQSKPSDKNNWIEKFGSSHLKRAYNMGYDCQRQYVTERSKKEYPDFALDFDGISKLKERPFPSIKALDLEERIRKGNQNISVRVEWMQKPEKEVEVVIIRDYLGKYLLYKTL
jgi:hypothetical protein